MPAGRVQAPRSLRWVAGLLALSLTGCSFLVAHPPPKAPRRDQPIECSTSIRPPVADVVLGVLGVATGVLLGWVAASVESDPELQPSASGPSSQMIYAWSILWGLGFAGSTAYGVRSARACEAALVDSAHGVFR